MKRTRLFVAVLFTLLFAGTFWSPAAPVQAQSGPTTITIPDYPWPRGSTQERIPLNIVVTQGGVRSFEFDISYINSGMFVALDRDLQASLTSGWVVTLRRTGQDSYHVEGYSGSPLPVSSQQRPLLYLVVNAVGNPVGGISTPIRMQNLLLNDGNPPSRIANEGSITVLPLKMYGRTWYRDTAWPLSVRIDTRNDTTNTAIPPAFSDSSGTFEFYLQDKGSYTFSFSKDRYTDLRNGISPYDALMVHQCSMGQRTDCLFEVSDVSGNGKIGAYDSALIAQWLLNHQQQPDSRLGDWLCNPQKVTKQISFDTQFVPVRCTLVGDVTGNWGSPSPGVRNSDMPVEVFLPETVTSISGIQVTIPITITGTGMEAVLLRFDSNSTPLGFDLPDGWSVITGDGGFLLLGEGPVDQIVFDLRLIPETSEVIKFTEVWVNESDPAVLDESVQFEVRHLLYFPSLQRQE